MRTTVKYNMNTEEENIPVFVVLSQLVNKVKQIILAVQKVRTWNYSVWRGYFP